VAGGRDAVATPVDGRITASDRLDHFAARWSIRRGEHRVAPGLYALGRPGPDSPVLVTANYTLSFDALRSAVAGIDAHILVLDTKGINVWCAAGKGTFGTDELVHRVEVCRLAEVVNHRILTVPQLGATGVDAREVLNRTRFQVRFGPVRASDLPRYLETGEATREMRTVTFGLADRAVLIPVEFVHVVLPAVVAAVLLYFLSGPLAAWAAVASVLAGSVVFPLLLPWLPTPNFSTRGAALGLLVALPFCLAELAGDGAVWARVGMAAGLEPPIVLAVVQQ